MNKNILRFRKRGYYTEADSRSVFFFAMITPLFFAVILSSIFSMAGIEGYETNPVLLVLASILSQLAFLSIYFCYNFFLDLRPFKASSLNLKINKRNILLSVILGVICLFGFNFLIEFFNQFFELFGYKGGGLDLPLNTLGWYFANVFILAALPAFCEELIFRGVILNGFMNKYKPQTAIVISAVLFALMHGSLQQLVFPFMLGLVLGFIFYKTGSIFYTMITHFINNFIVITINYIYNAMGTEGGAALPILLNLIIGVQLTLITVGIIFLLNNFWKRGDKRVQVGCRPHDTSKTLMWIGVCVSVFLLLFNMLVGE